MLPVAEVKQFLDSAADPQAARAGLPRSYPTVAGDDRAFMYDVALAVIAWSVLDPRRASAALHDVREVIAGHRGRVPFVVDVRNPARDSARNLSGTSAWISNAAVLYEIFTGDDEYRTMALQIAHDLAALTRQHGLVPIEAGRSAISTEHNIDVYFLFASLARLGVPWFDGDRAALVNAMYRLLWDGRRFRQGVDDERDALDCASWGAMFAAATRGPDSHAARACIDHAYVSFWNPSAPGFMPYPHGDKREHPVWIEGTLGVLAALLKLRDARSIALRRTIDGYARQTALGTAFPYALRRTRNFSDEPSIASTAWYTICGLLLTNRGFADAFWTAPPYGA